mgnify:CR=1 FL=1
MCTLLIELDYQQVTGLERIDRGGRNKIVKAGLSFYPVSARESSLMSFPVFCFLIGLPVTCNWGLRPSM